MITSKQIRDQVKEITEKLEKGIVDLFNSEKYSQYLKAMSHFHSYSPGNIFLIHSQHPDATRVADFETWRKKFGRTVKRGEKGIRILAPAAHKSEIETHKIDPDKRLILSVMLSLLVWLKCTDTS